MKELKGISITKLLGDDFKYLDEIIADKLKENKSYKENNKKFIEYLEALDNKQMNEVEGWVNRMEEIAYDTAFEEGFRMGVRLMIGCMEGVQ